LEKRAKPVAVTFLQKVSAALFRVVSKHLSENTEPNNETLQSTQPVFGSRFETRTSNIETQSYRERWAVFQWRHVFHVGWLEVLNAGTETYLSKQ
jgi:hypothetical protein